MADAPGILAADDAPTRVKVVYVAGAGRSGSTLLALLLSQSGACFDVGQIRDLASGFAKDVRCSCGAPLRTCAYWSAVIRRSCGADPASELKAGADGLKAFAKANDPRRVWASRARHERVAEEHAPLLANLRERYRACAAVAGVSTLIDSSKSPWLALALDMIPAVDLYVLNLVRDPRAVACSWMRKTGDRERVKLRCSDWKERQRELAAFARARPGRLLRVRYEELAASPRSTVAEIQRWAGLPADVSFFSSADRATLSWERQHLFPPTNEKMLAEKPTDVHIAPREDWRDRAQRRTRWLASRLTFPDNVRHGYGLM